MAIKNKKLLGIISIIIASLFWGGEFVVQKDVLTYVQPNYSNFIRYAIGSIICTIIWKNKLSNASVSDWMRGIVLGILGGLSFSFQTMGLETINAGVNAFICSSYVIITPFFAWILSRKRPNLNIFAGAVIAMFGVAMFSINRELNGLYFSKGIVLTLIGAVFSALCLVAIDSFSKKSNIIFLTIAQFYFASIVTLIFAILLEPCPQIINSKIAIEFVYLVVFGTVLAQLLTNYGMQYVKSFTAGIIFPLESVFAFILGIIILHERITNSMLIGSILIIIAIVFSNLEQKQKGMKNFN